MIIDGLKWACQPCIKGHRASTCKHEGRELSIIRPKGRPSTQCQICRSKRKNGTGSHSACQCNMPDEQKRKKRKLESTEGESEAGTSDRISEDSCKCGEGAECVCCRSSGVNARLSGLASTQPSPYSASRTSQSPGLSPTSPSRDTTPSTASCSTGRCTRHLNNELCDDHCSGTDDLRPPPTVPAKSSCCSGNSSTTLIAKQPSTAPLTTTAPRSTVSVAESAFTSDPLRALLQAVDIRLECDCGDDCACPGCMDEDHGGPDRARAPQKTASTCPTRCVSCSACGLGLNVPFSGIESVDQWLANDRARAQLQESSSYLPDQRQQTAFSPSRDVAEQAPSSAETHDAHHDVAASRQPSRRVQAGSQAPFTPQQLLSPMAESPMGADMTPSTSGLTPTPSAPSSGDTGAVKRQLHGGVLNEMGSTAPETDVHAELVLLHPACLTCADVVRRKGVGVLTRC